jgi:hypothetical protein
MSVQSIQSKGREAKRCHVLPFLFSFSRRQDPDTEFYLKKHQFDCYSIEMLLYPFIVIYKHIFLVLTSDFRRCYDHNLSRVSSSITSYKEQVD